MSNIRYNDFLDKGNLKNEKRKVFELVEFDI